MGYRLLWLTLFASLLVSGCTQKEQEALEKALMNPEPGQHSNGKSTGSGISSAESLETHDAAFNRHIYETGGIHNDKGCGESPCMFLRPAQAPKDPGYPDWWTSEWSMYRIFNNYQQNPPPYFSPPERLKPEDYQVSYGVTYYDSTYVPRRDDGTNTNYGAMMQHFDEYCLPLFDGSNKYTCSFVSLGNKTYLLRYDNRPEGTPECCMFSPMNHPPRLDFLKHLEYNVRKSQALEGGVDVYTKQFGPKGESMLGYAFEKQERPDIFDTHASPYRHPHSMFFTGSTAKPHPNAPLVSIHYKNFRMEKPDPEKTWNLVGKMCPEKPEWCCLFKSDCRKPVKSRRSTRPNKAAVD